MGKSALSALSKIIWGSIPTFDKSILFTVTDTNFLSCKQTRHFNQHVFLFILELKRYLETGAGVEATTTFIDVVSNNEFSLLPSR